MSSSVGGRGASAPLPRDRESSRGPSQQREVPRRSVSTATPGISATSAYAKNSTPRNATRVTVAGQSVPDALDHAPRHLCALPVRRAGLVRRPDDRVGRTLKDAVGDVPLSMVAMVRPVAIASRQMA